jgi:hypothetical protein
MSGVNRLIAELLRAANTVERQTPAGVTRMLHDAVEAVRQLRRQTNINPIPGKDALIYIRTVAAGADRVPMEEWRHAFLHAAEMIRDLSIVLDSGTTVTLVEPKQ